MQQQRSSKGLARASSGSGGGGRAALKRRRRRLWLEAWGWGCRLVDWAGQSTLGAASTEPPSSASEMDIGPTWLMASHLGPIEQVVLGAVLAALALFVILSEKRLRSVAEEKARLAEAKLLAERRISTAKTALNHLCNKDLAKGIKVTDEKSLSEIDIPSSVDVSSILSSATSIVQTFNNDTTPTNESNMSIRKSRSVHKLWSQLFNCIRDGDTQLFSQDCMTRILYECSIPHPETRTSLRIDFSFVSSATCSPSWEQLRGGIELKNNPKNNSSTNGPKGNLHSGFKQAFSRCARCVLARAEACEWHISPGGCEKAFMLYGDGRRMGLVFVSLDVDLQVSVTNFSPMNLPGFNGADDTTPLRLLKFVLTSPEQDLKQIMSPLPKLENRKISGVLFDSNKSILDKEECEWETATLLGQGGFGYVCALKVDAPEDCDSGELAFPVVKATVLAENCFRLENEKKLLDSLNKSKPRCVNIPLCTGALSISSTDHSVCAIKLSARGVSLPHFLRCLAPDSRKESFEQVVRVLGPAVLDALLFAHSRMICHCDVRPPNMILVPPTEAMVEIAKLGGDIAERLLIGQIDVSTVRCILNDWGEARDFSSQRVGHSFQEQKIIDLTRLVKVVVNPAHLVRGSDHVSESTSGGAVPAGESATGAGSFLLSSEQVLRLTGLAQNLDYAALKNELTCVKFSVQKPPSSRTEQHSRSRNRAGWRDTDSGCFLQ